MRSCRVFWFVETVAEVVRHERHEMEMVWTCGTGTKEWR